MRPAAAVCFFDTFGKRIHQLVNPRFVRPADIFRGSTGGPGNYCRSLVQVLHPHLAIWGTKPELGYRFAVKFQTFCLGPSLGQGLHRGGTEARLRDLFVLLKMQAGKVLASGDEMRAPLAWSDEAQDR